MGSRSAAKASRSKAIGNSGSSKGPVKSSNAGGKQSQGEDLEEYEDLSVLRKSVGTSVNGLIHALKVFQTGTEEVRSLLSQECKVIYECRVCSNLFRSLANFLSHKRIYCKGFASAVHPTGSSSCQPNGLLPYGGHGSNPGEPQSDGSLEMVIVQPEPPPKRQRNESPDHWLCNESTPSSDSIFVGPLPKLECSVPPIRRRKDICGVIEKLSKRASRQHLANTTAVASHFSSFTGGQLCLDNAVNTSTSNALYMENISGTEKAVYQTLLCASSSSVKLSFPLSGSEHSEMPCSREVGSSMDTVSTQGCAANSISKLLSASEHLPDPTPCAISDYAPTFPVPHNLLIKKRVALMKEAIAESESGVLGPDGVLIPTPKTNGPIYPPEVCSGGMSNSEGEEVEDEDEDGEEASPKGKSKSDTSKAQSAEEKEEIICSICKAKFSTRKTLSHHMKSLHVMFRTYYRCPCCKACFANNWSVYRHLYKVHHKTTDQVRKLRALIKKKAFRKKIILPLPNSSSEQDPQPVAANQPKDSNVCATSSAPVKASSPPVAKSSASSTSASKVVSSAPGRSGSPLPPPSEATQFPAISAQHAQVLRKLENIVKEDNSWRLESFPERPGMGQSCPGCNRRFERRAALASHAHSCHKRILLAAQKASRARNKQQQQKMGKPVTTGVSSGEAVKNPKGLLKSKEAAEGKHAAQEKARIVRIKFGKDQAGVVNFHRGRIVKKEDALSEDEGEAHIQGISSNKAQQMKLLPQKGAELHAHCVISSPYKVHPELVASSERSKDDDSEEMERPNSASSFGTYRDSSSPLTIPSQPGRQQRIGIQIRKDYVKGDRVSVCSSGPSPPPYLLAQASKDGEEADDEVAMASSKGSVEEEVVSVKESSATPGGDSCINTDGGNSVNPQIENSLEIKREVVEKEEMDEEETDKAASIGGSTSFQSEDENSSIEGQTSGPEGKMSQALENPGQRSQVESIIGPHGEVKRVFLEVIVGGVADPNSLAVDDEESIRDGDDSTRREEKGDAGAGGGSGPRRGTNPRAKPPPSLMISTQQRQGGRPVRNRVKVEREDFIYDLSDMKLSPTKKEDVAAGSSLPTAKKTRRNISQQQMVSCVSQSSNGSSVGGPSSVKHALVPSAAKVEGSGRAQSSSSLNNEGGHALRVYSGKAMGSSLPADKSVNKVPLSAKGTNPPPATSQKLGDCRVVIGGLRSGDMTQLSVRRVYSSSRKVLSPSNMTPEAVESEVNIACNASKKCPPSKDCNSEVEEGVFGDVVKVEAPVLEKPVGKTSSRLYQSDSLDSGDSVSDFGSAHHVNSPSENTELNRTT